jgi:hypothetical protein
MILTFSSPEQSNETKPKQYLSMKSKLTPTRKTIQQNTTTIQATSPSYKDAVLIAKKDLNMPTHFISPTTIKELQSSPKGQKVQLKS